MTAAERILLTLTFTALMGGALGWSCWIASPWPLVGGVIASFVVGTLLGCVYDDA